MNLIECDSQAKHYAHSTSFGIETWELLADHCYNVASLASMFADKFGGSEFGRVLGKWHDLGKYSLEFQSYLKNQNGIDVHSSETTGRVDHSTAGSQFSVSLSHLHIPIRFALAYCIAGHHSGLANAVEGRRTTALLQRFNKPIPEWKKYTPEHMLDCPELSLPPAVDVSIRKAWTGADGNVTLRTQQRTGLVWAMFVRMLFSSLVDADFLATEQFMTPEAAKERPKRRSSLAELNHCIDQHIEKLQSLRSGRIPEIRRSVLQACHDAAQLPPGLFSLSVPTGGGKTLASLSFAVRHMLFHSNRKFDRIVIAIPFTSIIEQTADVLRSVFSSLDDDVILEHHSSLECEQETTRSRLASQNFDAPIVVTTNVQLFESLFANRTSRCRKLHNIARSVIILDEAQTLPIELMEPTLLAIQELVDSYGCTIVLCTATLPAIGRSESFPIGLCEVREIIPEPRKLYESMRRTDVRYEGKLTLAELVGQLSSQRQFLCIHNTRPLASKTFQMLRDEGVPTKGLFHLSTFMCPTHRRKVLEAIRSKLKEGKRCQVVSTQLIEAGVDVDFPVVYRSIAGMDSIAQAAGRCNREGLFDAGTVKVFSLPELPPPGFLRSTASTALTLVDRYASDLIHPEAIQHYFQVHYWQNQSLWDNKGILAMHIDGLRKGMVDFEAIADAYRLIDDRSTPVVVPFNKEARLLINRLRSSDPATKPLSRRERQQIGQFSVSLFSHVVEKNMGSEFEFAYEGQFVVLLNESLYDSDLGIDLSKVNFIDPGSLVI
jgi:CRISPR-associated endonuclease/helicase Cas3